MCVYVRKCVCVRMYVRTSFSYSLSLRLFFHFSNVVVTVEGLETESKATRLYNQRYRWITPDLLFTSSKVSQDVSVRLVKVTFKEEQRVLDVSDLKSSIIMYT